MGGDFGLRSAFPASLRVLEEQPDLHLHLVGDSAVLESKRQQCGSLAERIHLLHAPDNVAMESSPSALLRAGTSSSMLSCLQLLRDGEVSGIVSAGNTGALVALGRKHLGLLDGCTRPALCSRIPTRKGQTYLLDLGANVDSSAQLLEEFALMGAALVRALHGVSSPAVALLSNGSEASKGNAVVREVASRLDANTGLNYIGYCEGDALFDGDANVVVCDGFAGNIALKTMEGTARFVLSALSDIAEDANLSADSIADSVLQQLDPETHSGAFLLGMNGVVVKSHGHSSPGAFSEAIRQAIACVEYSLADMLKAVVNQQTE